MRFLVGDDNGLCKVINVDKKEIVCKFGKQGKNRAVHALHWSGDATDDEAPPRIGGNNDNDNCTAAGSSEDAHAQPAEYVEEREVTCVLKSGKVEVYKTSTFEKLGRCYEAPEDVVFSEVRDGRLLIVSRCGAGRLIKGWKGYDPGNGDMGVGTFQLPGPVGAVSVDPTNPSLIAFGGEENDLKIFDLEKSEIVWKAKNLPNDKLDLRIPVLITVTQYIQIDGRLLIFVGTKDGKLRVYDTTIQRRPLVYVPVAYRMTRVCAYTAVSDDAVYPVTAICVKDKVVYLGDTVGNVCMYNLAKLKDAAPCGLKAGRKAQMDHARKVLPYVGGYRGVQGSVRGLALHPDENILVVVGLGRFAFVYDTKRRKKNAQVYLKQKLNCVLFSSEPSVQAQEKNSSECASEDEEDEECMDEEEDEEEGREKEDEEVGSTNEGSENEDEDEEDEESSVGAEIEEDEEDVGKKAEVPIMSGKKNKCEEIEEEDEEEEEEEDEEEDVDKAFDNILADLSEDSEKENRNRRQKCEITIKEKTKEDIIEDFGTKKENKKKRITKEKKEKGRKEKKEKKLPNDHEECEVEKKKKSSPSPSLGTVGAESERMGKKGKKKRKVNEVERSEEELGTSIKPSAKKAKKSEIKETPDCELTLKKKNKKGNKSKGDEKSEKCEKRSDEEPKAELTAERGNGETQKDTKKRKREKKTKNTTLKESSDEKKTEEREDEQEKRCKRDIIKKADDKEKIKPKPKKKRKKSADLYV